MAGEISGDRAADDETLLQERLDGVLNEADLARVEARCAANSSMRRRADQLDALSAALEGRRAGDTPSVVDDVMAVIQPGVAFWRRQSNVRAKSPLPVKVARKNVAIGLAAAAVLVIGLVLASRSRDEVIGAQGTVGAAHRSESPQLTGAGAPDTSVQTFQEGAAFADLLKDTSAMQLLADAALRSRLAAPVPDATDPGVAQALTNPRIARALKDAGFVKILTDANFDRMVVTQRARPR